MLYLLLTLTAYYFQQLYFGSHAHGKFNLFKSDGAKDLLFSDDTKKLLPLWMNCSAEVRLDAL